MDHLFESLLSAGNIISVLVTAAVTWAGSFLFYKQRRDGMNIENEAKRSDEWRKLYVESQEDSRKKDEKIDGLRKEMQQMRENHANEMIEMRRQLIALERKVQLNTIYRCDKLDCPNRPKIPRYLDTDETKAALSETDA